MLIDALPTLQQEIQNALQTGLIQAQMTQIAPSNDEMGAAMTAMMQSMAMNYATAAATTAAPMIAQAIYKFVSQIGITAMPKTLTTTTPGNPITGVINMKDFIIS